MARAHGAQRLAQRRRDGLLYRDVRAAALVWRAISLPLLALLIFMLPAVQTLLWLLAFFSVVAGCFLRFFTDIQDAPFWGLLACSAGCAALLMGYQRLIRFLS